jgi:ATP-dependent protease HslVU (ClpYQ) peptidase subunit
LDRQELDKLLILDRTLQVVLYGVGPLVQFLQVFQIGKGRPPQQVQNKGAFVADIKTPDSVSGQVLQGFAGIQADRNDLIGKKIIPRGRVK